MPGLVRWWDGSAWSQHTHALGAEGTGGADDEPVDAQTAQPWSQPRWQLNEMAEQEWGREPLAFPSPAGISPEVLMLGFVAGNFCSAFFQTLGKRAADGAVRLPKQATDLLRKRVRRKGKPDQYYIGLKRGASATVVVTESTPDEARLALLDLDVMAPELRGRELRWDQAAGAWRPSEASRSSRTRRRPSTRPR